MMKGRVEDRDVRHRRKKMPHSSDTGEHHRVMQRREWIERFHSRNRFVGDQCAFSEFFAPVHHAMRNHADFARAAR